MKRIILSLIILASFVAKAQVFNNEWIDPAKTYYKFKLAKTGLYRISAATLTSAGLGAAQVQSFQLWRNGKQVPIYTSVTSGTLSASDYIEFWGEMNDGRPDQELYRFPQYQLNNKWSLESDSAVYFLTINPGGSNLRLANTANNVSGTSLTPEPYFLYTTGTYYKDKLNPGQGIDLGEAYLYLSDYDFGEGWTSNDIDSGRVLNTKLSNLFLYSGGPAAQLKIGLSGNKVANRKYTVAVNGTQYMSGQVDFFDIKRDNAAIPVTAFSSDEASIDVTNNSSINGDKMVVHTIELTYPRQFNFGGASNFEFTLPASAAASYLVINNFNYGSSTPVLYDLINGQRYIADMGATPAIRFVVQASATERRLVLVNEETGNIASISGLETRKFTDLSNAANQGDYIIITNQSLLNGQGGIKPVDDYRDYRSSVAGGSYNAKVYLVDELIDQFGFGIKMNPLGIRNFLRFARAKFSITPRQVFLIGKGVNYLNNRAYEGDASFNKLSLVPTFGYPPSDGMLTADPGSPVPQLPIGRLSVIDPSEIALYLKKVKDQELTQKFSPQTIPGKDWMKNVVHINGVTEPSYQLDIRNSLNSYANIIKDTLFGGKVTTFEKTTSGSIQQLNNTSLQNLFQEGISLITYFGHSSATTLEFNLDNPENYNNFGKYPLFIGLGCNAGNFFTYNGARLSTKETLSEKYVLSQDRGVIGFVASTHYGVIYALNIIADSFYRNASVKSYGKTIGEILRNAAADALSAPDELLTRSNTQQSALHGDPAVYLNPHAKPDYVITDSMLKISPGFISVADFDFTVDAKYLNIGKAISNLIVAEIKHTHPDGSVTYHRDTISGIRYDKEFIVKMPIVGSKDKGTNRITVTIDAGQAVDELDETNNSVSKEFIIYESEARPVYPYDLAIINKQNIKFAASTANPLDSVRQYRMELDTTELFNSPFKISVSATSAGGLIEFKPSITFTDSTVYYWRVAPVPVSGPFTWNKASFIYLPNYEEGFNQSHVYQQFKSSGINMSLDSATRQWKYGKVINNVFIRQGSWVTSGATQEAALSIAVNGDVYNRVDCWWQDVEFSVWDPVTFLPWINQRIIPGSPVGGLYGSAAPNCFEPHNFDFRWDSTSSRKRAMDFMQNVVPDGAYVVVRSFLLDPNAFPSYASKLKYASEWAADTTVFGAGQSLYHYLKNAGFADIDSFNRPRQFAFIYKKNDPSFTPRWVLSQGTWDNPTLSVDCAASDTVGYIVSAPFGPAKGWKEVRWNGYSMESGTGDNPIVDIMGIRTNGTVDTLFRVNQSQKVVNISSVNPVTYPNIKLGMRNTDTTNYTPYQLSYWRVTYQPAPEGAIAPNIYFQMRDTVEAGEPIDFKVAFKNVSNAAFPDSIKVKFIVTDKNNSQHVLPIARYKAPLNANDTLSVRYSVDTRPFTGVNTLYVEINPDNDQPEQYHFNNFLYKQFYVKPDTLHPVLDVTFDNVHILNNDVVSSKPDIAIKLKDESKWMLLTDTSLVSVQIRYPNKSIRTYHFDSDTMKFTPATQGPNPDNTATINLKPYLQEDGVYELIVTGKDLQGNGAGTLEYKVSFEVINKAMISNMLNYPNPFTTSTAFVFTLTGSEVPSNFKIQVLTITGKVVREITREELGPIHIGRNITEFKWDGTDQFGQKLANGVYLYRVVTQLDGKSLDKYQSKTDDTDKYFKKGYGKMYLMR